MMDRRTSMPRALIRRAALVVLPVVIALIAAPRAVFACSGDPFDPNRADAIVEGWVERMTLRRDLRPPNASPKDPVLIPAEVTLRVTRVLKGAAATTLTFIDWGSVAPGNNGDVRFMAGGGPCGILGADPTGKYALIVFTRDAAGAWRVSAIQGAAFGAGPDALDIARLRAHLVGQLQPRAMPNVGAGGLQATSGGASWVPAALLGGGLLLVTALSSLLLLVWRASHRPTGA